MKIIVTSFDGARLRVAGMALDTNLGFCPTAEQFKLWRYSSGWFPVDCSFRRIDSIASGRDIASGRAITIVNDEVVCSDPDLAVPATRFQVAEPFQESPPFLLLPSASGRPGSRSALVQLHFSRLSEIPDVRGKYELSRDWASALVPDNMPELKEKVLEPSSDPAAQSPPSSGLWLPFEIGSIQGAMRLGQQRDEGLFDATLYIERDAESIAAGALLRRSVTWTTLDGNHGSAEADIATVLEVT